MTDEPEPNNNNIKEIPIVNSNIDLEQDDLGDTWLEVMAEVNNENSTSTASDTINYIKSKHSKSLYK